MFTSKPGLLNLPNYLASISKAEQTVFIVSEKGQSHLVKDIPASYKEEVQVNMS